MPDLERSTFNYRWDIALNFPLPFEHPQIKSSPTTCARTPDTVQLRARQLGIYMLDIDHVYDDFVP
jgi:hypothetical protein